MKKTRISSHWLLLLTIVYWALTGEGAAVHAIDIAELVKTSDVIVVGRVISITDQGATTIEMPGGSIPGRKLLAVLSADETLKGTTETTNLQLDFAMPEAPSGIRSIPRGQYGIFFLRRGTPTYRVSDPVYPFLPALPNGTSSNGLPLDRVIAKLAEVLSSKNSADSEISSALNALAVTQGASATEALHRALETGTGDLQLRIASKLVARNDIGALDIVEKALTHPVGLSDHLLLNLAGSLGGLKDPRAVPALKRLLETKDQNIIKGTAIALRQSGSSEALEPLSRLLTNSDEQVRYYAVVGMGEITRQDEWTPTFPEFREHEAKYLSYWRDWANSNLPHQAAK